MWLLLQVSRCKKKIQAMPWAFRDAIWMHKQEFGSKRGGGEADTL